MMPKYRSLAKIVSESAARRLAESRNRVPAIGGAYGTYGTYGNAFIKGGWTRS